MSCMDHNTAFATAGGIQELSIDEVNSVFGATDRGSATSTGVTAGAATGAVLAAGNAAAIGTRIGATGAAAGPVGLAVGVIGGAIVRGLIGYVAYRLSE